VGGGAPLLVRGSDAADNDEMSDNAMPADHRDEPITSGQGYDAMFLFLLDWWKRGGRQSEDVEWILNAMDRSSWQDGESNDPAIDHDWRKAVDRIRQGHDPYTDWAR
jgi:hypothetical protein